MRGRYDWEECTCPCHENPDAVKHFRACCYTCQHCGKRIKTHSHRKHEKECKMKVPEIPEVTVPKMEVPKVKVSQDAVRLWVLRCFGEEPTEENSPERALRFLEEAMELVQAAGMDFMQVVHMACYVYGRPAETEIEKEFGGTLTTLMALAQSKGVDLMEAANTEFARMLKNVAKIRAKQQAKPDEVKG